MTAPDPRVGEIEARLAAATPGPWANYGNLGHEIYAVNAHEEDMPEYIAEVVHRKPDAHFIANAPADVAYLLAELRKAHEALTRATVLIRALTDPDNCHFDHHGGCQAHGYLDLQPGELCPQLEAKVWVHNAAVAGANGDGL